MTWKEFKQLVDAELAAAGNTEAVEIEYIDTSHPCTDHPMCELSIHVSSDGYMSIHA